MKPAWDQLMAQYADSPISLVAEVDCTADGKPLCETMGVESFPTIKYGEPSGLETYTGPREFADLDTFARENLGPACGPKNLDLCDPETKAQIEELMRMSVKELEAEIEKKEAELKAAETTRDAEVAKLQEAFEQLKTDKKAKDAAIQASGASLLKAVRKIRNPASNTLVTRVTEIDDATQSAADAGSLSESEVDKIIWNLKADVKHILEVRKNAAALIVVVTFLVGLAFGVVVTRSCCSGAVGVGKKDD